MLFGGGGSASTSTGNGLRTETGGFGDPNLETCSSNYENGGLCNGAGGGPGGGPGGTSFRRSFRTKATYVLRPETVRQMVVITTTTAKNGKRSSASAPLADLKLLQQNGTGNGCRKNVGTLSTEFYHRKNSKDSGGGGGNPRGLRLTSSE